MRATATFLDRWLWRSRRLLEHMADLRYRLENIIFELRSGAQTLWLLLDTMGTPIAALSVSPRTYPSLVGLGRRRSWRRLCLEADGRLPALGPHLVHECEVDFVRLEWG